MPMAAVAARLPQIHNGVIVLPTRGEKRPVGENTRSARGEIALAGWQGAIAQLRPD